MDQSVYGLVYKRAREEERTPADRLGRGVEEDLRGSSLEESSIGEERVEKDGTDSIPNVNKEKKSSSKQSMRKPLHNNEWLNSRQQTTQEANARWIGRINKDDAQLHSVNWKVIAKEMQ
ncbi:unnamed protein product [Nezara viridula]|uniref:Uncharacterized protein n=1 Tax=Nezara viridula TaxID=85310 RepID=A0A9P0HQC4_NEZVI|nr:unnamed protein product [Nezara viridula]